MSENQVNKRFFNKLTVFIVGGSLLAIFLFARGGAPAPATTPQSNSNAASSTTDEEIEELGIHGIGESKTGVVLIEYGDFASEASKAYQPMMQQIMDKYGDQLRFVYRDFPTESSAASMTAQRAANAAESQGMFWRMRELLYERQAAWKDNAQAESMFESYAKELGVDMKQYKQALASKSVSNAITTDIASGQKLQVSTTPALFINDKAVPANISFESLSKLIDEAIAANYKPAS